MSKKGYLILTITLGATLAGLMVVLIVFIAISSSYKTQLENVYSRSFYELSQNINDLEVDISKLIATTDSNAQKEILNDIYTTCTVANINISNMPVSSSSINNINYFVNKLGGYCYSLITKLDNGQSMTNEDFNNINTMHSHTLNLMYEFNNYIKTFSFNYSMVKQINYKNQEKSKLNGAFDNIQSTISEIPTLIYDGPFADSVLTPDIKGLPNYEIDSDIAKQIILESFSGFNIKKLEYTGEAKGLFTTFNYKLQTDEVSLFIQITKQGGFLLDITSVGEGKGELIEPGRCNELAVEFARSLGFNDLYAVWDTVNDNIAYVNLAPIVNGVIYYPDLIKVKMDRALGMVTGWEAKNYAYNHVERIIPTANLDITQAQSKISPLLEVKNKNKCIIPKDYGGELYAYEFVCKWKDYTYYVYIDALTGKEAKILRIINTTSGNLIM